MDYRQVEKHWGSMAGSISSPPPGEQQQAPDTSDQRIDNLEKRVRSLEDTINKFSGAMSVIRWIVPPLLIVGGAVLVFFLGQSSG